MRSAETLEEKVRLMAGYFEGTTCVIVTCGPSLQLVDGERLRQAVRGVPVIAVKQAISTIGEQADFHCWNPYNVSRFRWPSSDTLRVMVRGSQTNVPQWNRADVKFPQIEGKGDLRNSLAYSHTFADHLLSDQLVRPFGPGIMYELVVYLAVHLGCTRLITFGWDIADVKGRNTHFDDSALEHRYFERGRGSQKIGSNRRTWRDAVPQQMQQLVRASRTARAHFQGRRYNLTASLNGEVELVSSSTEHLCSWLNGMGVELAVVTDSSHLSAGIARLSPESAFAELQEAGTTGR